MLLCKFAALSDNGVHEVLYDWFLAVFVGLFAVEVARASGGWAIDSGCILERYCRQISKLKLSSSPSLYSLLIFLWSQFNRFK